MSGRDLVTYLRDRVDDSLRGVIKYQEGITDIIYLRDDIREVRLQSQIDRMLNRLEPESHAAEERAFPFGDLYVTVRRFEEDIIMHFPTGIDVHPRLKSWDSSRGSLNRPVLPRERYSRE